MSGNIVKVVIPLDDAGAKAKFDELAAFMTRHVKGPDTNSYFLEVFSDIGFFRDVEEYTYRNTGGHTASKMIRKIERLCSAHRKGKLLASHPGSSAGMTLQLTLQSPNKAMLLKLMQP